MGAAVVEGDGNGSPSETSEEEEEARTMEATKKLWDASAAGDSCLAVLCEALAGGARVDWRDAEDRGNCALHKAAEGGALAIVRVLLTSPGCWGRGAAPSSQNAFNDTPLHAAAFKGHSDVVEVLIEAQADVNARSDDGESALHCASFGGHSHVCSVLLLGGALVDAISPRDGDTPLHLAALGRHVPVVEVLLAAGARMDIRNKDECTAVELADIQQHEDVIDILRANSRAESYGASRSPCALLDATFQPGEMAANGRVVSGDLAAEEQPPTAPRKNRGKKKKAPGAQV